MHSRLLNDKSMVFERADPYAVSEYVNQHVGSHCIQLPVSSRPQANLNHSKFASLDLCRISYGDSVHVTSPALETIYHLQILLRGQCLSKAFGKEHYFEPGELLLINPDDPVDLLYSADCEKFILKLPLSVLETTCADLRWHKPSEGIRFASSRHNLAELDGFMGLLGLVCQEAETDLVMPRVREHYTQIIASKLLTLLGSNVVRESLEVQSAPFERLAEYIAQNLKQDITADSLARLSHMSLRSLYALFERHAGTTPMNYIRRKKLERIQMSLSDPNQRVRNLTEIALDYGFLHLGRFSEYYKHQFGELPSVTLKRR
ncbi:AraC family transcriptional regulator [Pseudomonas sp. NA-150]|uniref:AraC family transcriptional regulator n=1 Tax=Pseudomonas sp. NA-150 TaxID=3367525 RepID=UPI0037C89A34